MPLTINTNVSSLITQRNLNSATSALNNSIERMTTGYTINHAKDNAAGYSIANQWVTKLGSIDVATNNAATGSDLLTTAEETYSLLTSHLQRVRDLTEQAANGTYGSQSLRAIQSEVKARFQEISRIAANSEFNGIKLLAYKANDTSSGIKADGIDLQIGLYADKDSIINLSTDLFKDASVSGLFSALTTPANSTKTLSQLMAAANQGGDITKINLKDGYDVLAAACTGLKFVKNGNATVFYLGTVPAKEMLGYIDAAIDDITDRVTQIGAAQNRVSSAITALDVQAKNLTSSLSTLRDTDVAKESSNYIQSQILQQASATLLSTANQLPSVALNLI